MPGDVDVPHEAQIVVIGGGVLGTSAAFHLAAAGQQNIGFRRKFSHVNDLG